MASGGSLEQAPGGTSGTCPKHVPRERYSMTTQEFLYLVEVNLKISQVNRHESGDATGEGSAPLPTIFTTHSQDSLKSILNLSLCGRLHCMTCQSVYHSFIGPGLAVQGAPILLCVFRTHTYCVCPSVKLR